MAAQPRRPISETAAPQPAWQPVAVPAGAGCTQEPSRAVDRRGRSRNACCPACAGGSAAACLRYPCWDEGRSRPQWRLSPRPSQVPRRPQHSRRRPAAAASIASPPRSRKPRCGGSDETAPPAAPASRQPLAAATSSMRPSASVAQPPQAAVAAQPPPPAGPSAKEIQDAHDRFADLDARAGAAKSGVQSIRRQQQAQGFDLRGDILAAMSRLDNDMNEANQALNRNDPATANQYMDRADRELATLESFLGR